MDLSDLEKLATILEFPKLVLKFNFFKIILFDYFTQSVDQILTWLILCMPCVYRIDNFISIVLFGTLSGNIDYASYVSYPLIITMQYI